MNSDNIAKVSTELNLKEFQVKNIIKLLFEEECTIPFVARYRKEMTGSVDEVVLRSVRDRFDYLQDLDAARTKYLKVVEEHCKSNPLYKGKYPELKDKFEKCTTKQELEDLYLPFKPKRKTRASVAKAKGLEPLLENILANRSSIDNLEEIAQEYVTPEGTPDETAVKDVAAALKGAADILAERISETADYRAAVRDLSQQTGEIVSQVVDSTRPADDAGNSKTGKASKKTDASKYENYFDYREPIATAPSHRIMAVRRGESEKILRVSIDVDKEEILSELKSLVLGEQIATDCVKEWMQLVIEDAYKRLIGPSIEAEIRIFMKNRAEEEAIRVFSLNLQKLLLLPPVPRMVVMGVDPGIRTGSKLAVVDETGKPLETTTIYPDPRGADTDKDRAAAKTIVELVKKHNVKCFAIGNGTGSREIDRFITKALKEAQIEGTKRVVVNEAGASVYSTEEVAREEFPDLDATLRSAISIARRLQDPLAELVKINPRSIGVGQYQHDVNPGKLGRSLEEVVESCVNHVGVNLNTASYKLLGYVSGIGPTLAKGIVKHRDANGGFKARSDIQNVSGLGPKVYQQAAGFMRVPESQNPLDNTGVHPERYEIVEQIALGLNKPVREISGNKDLVDGIPWEKYVTEAVGMPTLKDIAGELSKPGRDPREEGSRLLFSDKVSELDDLKIGMHLQGTVTNVTNFGCFVDIGVHQDGLVHISELSDQFVQDPTKVVAVGDVLNVRVLAVDVAKRRLSLSCKSEQSARADEGQRQTRADSGQGNRGGAGRGGQHRSGGRANGKGAPRHGANSGRPASRAPEKQHTIGDLLSKFNKR